MPMINRATRLRWRRRVRQRKQQVEGLGVQAEEQLERHFFKRLSHLATVRRFIAGWLVFFLLLIGGVVYQTTALSQYYQTLKPVPGGTFTEGIVGIFTDANPLYATGAVDGAVARLLFAGLLKYDNNNALVGDLAESVTPDENGAVFTVKLRPDLQWHDGHPLTAEDVVFTYTTIQNPDAKSPLMASWQGIKVEAQDDRTVVFTLPTTLASFPHSLTNGIVPKHLLGDTPAAQLRTLRFNTVDPVGSGPLRWDKIQVTGDTPETRESTIAFVPNEHYHGGAPRLQRFVIRAFLDQEHMIKSFQDKELTAMSGLDIVPDDFSKDLSVHEYNVPLSGEVMVFFRTSHEYLQDTKVRRALVQATDQNALIGGIGYPVVAARGPLLASHLGYDKSLTQLPYDVAAANKQLDEAGWVRSGNGTRTKDGKELQFNLFARSTGEYAYVTQKLQADWTAIGVKVNVTLQSDDDLQSTVTFHTYDALLYGVSVGPDPDVFAYWHSAQADIRAPNRVNFSEYKSNIADKALDAGRTRTDAALRAIKYRPFLEAWRNDAPALALYQPRFLYITRNTIAGFEPTIVNSATDRYNSVQHWMILQAKVAN